MNSLFSRMGTSWSRPTDAPPPPGDGPRAPPPPPPGAAPGKDDDIYRPRDRSPDSVLEDPSNWARDDGSASSEATPPPRALERAASAPAAASCGDLRGILADKPKKKLRKSVSFHSTVSLVRSESLSDLPAEEKHRIWYRSDDYSRFVHSELGRRREMGVTSTSLIMPTRVAHFEVEDDYASDGDARMDDWRVGCDSDSYSDSDEGSGGDAPVRVVG